MRNRNCIYLPVIKEALYTFNRLATDKNMISIAYRFLILLMARIPSLGFASDTRSLIKQLESVPAAESHVYRLLDDKGMGMDCLKVFQPANHNHGQVMGVYHHRKGGVFSIHLARSTDLINWSYLRTLDKHASQATIWQCDNNAFFLAYEKDAPNSCWIRIRYYESLPALIEGKHLKEFDIPRTLAPTAEGTPSFESVSMEGNRIDDSEIRLRFHYFKNVRVDQLATGKLTNFNSWDCEPLNAVNSELIRRGWLGNLGDRDKFIWKENVYYLQEIQRVRNDWSSWRVSLCQSDGMPIHDLEFKTHKGSIAFANPNATWIHDTEKRRKLVVTLFLPSEGNHPEEVGTLLYVIDPKTAEQSIEAVDERAP